MVSICDIGVTSDSIVGGGAKSQPQELRDVDEMEGDKILFLSVTGEFGLVDGTSIGLIGIIGRKTLFHSKAEGSYDEGDP